MNTKNPLSRRLSTIFSFAAILLAFLLSSCQVEAEKWDSFGAQITSKDALPTSAMVEAAQGSDSISVKFEGEIDQVCQMKGCWMTLKSADGNSIRVTFKDYGFFVPKEAGGSRVIVEGVAAVKELDEATARHYAEDAGREFDAAANLKEISVVASGVLIVKPAQL